MGASGAPDGSSNLPRATNASQVKGIFGLFSLGKRKCVCCGAELGDEDIMKIILEDGSCEVFPLDTCPECFKKALAKKAHR